MTTTTFSEPFASTTIDEALTRAEEAMAAKDFVKATEELQIWSLLGAPGTQSTNPNTRIGPILRQNQEYLNWLLSSQSDEAVKSTRLAARPRITATRLA